MKPPKFDYIRVETSDEAVDLLAEYGDDARILAGGQSLMPMMNMRLVRPQVLVDIAHTSDLQGISKKVKKIEIGAATTQADLGDWINLSSDLPLLASAIPSIGHFQTRNRGTVCGSLCHADPSSELPACLMLLDGEVELRSKKGARSVKADDFLIGVLTTAKRADELAVKAIYPIAQEGAKYAFTEFHHRHGDFAVVGIAGMAFNNRIRVAIGGVADRPEVREWESLEGGDIDDALNDFAWELRGSDDIHATAQHRRELVRHLGRQLIDNLHSQKNHELPQ